MDRFSVTAKSLPISEIVRKSPKLSPFEDLKRRTLSAIFGRWQRFLYVVELRTPEGKYDHWGHNRVYGDLNSQAALAKAHSELYLEVLRTPLWDLTRQGTEGEEVVREPHPAFSSLMIPADLQGGSPRHLSSVALALRLLNAERQASSRSTA